MDEISLALVVVTHNSARWVPGFFASWRETSKAAGMEAVELVVADAGSTDETVSAIRVTVPGAFVHTLSNIGFGAAANAAIARIPSAVTHVLLCNPDLTFRPDFLQRLLESLQQRKAIAVVAPQLLNDDGSRQPSVGAFPTIRGITSDQFQPPERRKYLRKQPDCAQRIDWATGACLLLRRNAFAEVGGFDEKFFLYVEEVDLFRRLRSAGHEAWFVPEAAVVHHAPNAGRAPRPEVQRWSSRGLLRYFAKHGRLGQLITYRALAAISRRLPPSEAFASHEAILQRPTGP